jgi:hypothetical protein
MCADYDTLTPEQALNVVHSTIGCNTTFRDAQNGSLKHVIRRMLEVVYPDNPLFDPLEVDQMLKDYMLYYKHEVKHVNLKSVRV